MNKLWTPLNWIKKDIDIKEHSVYSTVVKLATYMRMYPGLCPTSIDHHESWYIDLPMFSKWCKISESYKNKPKPHTQMLIIDVYITLYRMYVIFIHPTTTVSVTVIYRPLDFLLLVNSIAVFHQAIWFAPYIAIRCHIWLLHITGM